LNYCLKKIPDLVSRINDLTAIQFRIFPNNMGYNMGPNDTNEEDFLDSDFEIFQYKKMDIICCIQSDLFECIELTVMKH
jgi:hypothetical protein